MLSEKPWKADAVFRLFVSVLICIFMGALAVSVIRFTSEAQKAKVISFFSLVVVAFGLLAGALWILSRPWHYETFTRNFVALLVCVYAGFLLTWLAMRMRGDVGGQENSTFRSLIAILSFQGAALVLIHRFLREHGIGWSEAFGFGIQWKQMLLLGAALALVILPIGWGMQETSAYLMEHLRIQPQEQQSVEVLRAAGGWARRLVLGVAIILIAPVAEEMLFRGILYPAIKQSGYPQLALWGTSVFFGAIHLNLAAFLPLTLLALVLVLLYERTNNLLAPIATHSLFNAANFAILYLGESLSRLPVRS